MGVASQRSWISLNWAEGRQAGRVSCAEHWAGLEAAGSLEEPGVRLGFSTSCDVLDKELPISISSIKWE